MSPHVLFLPPKTILLRPNSRPLAWCPRRQIAFVTFASARLPADDENPSWTDLARSLGSSDKTPTRPPPEWKLPDGDELPNAEQSSSAWSAWNAAQGSDLSPEAPRDPRKETDFWRAAARELSSTEPSPIREVTTAGQDLSSNEDVLPPAIPDQTSLEASIFAAGLGPEPSSQAEIWNLARGVTGQMADLQNRLRADLDRFDPDENKDQYRDIARELVGPKSDEPWSEADPTRPGTTEGREGIEDSAEAGSGWNPDVDWKRYDDIRRDEALQQDKAARAEVARIADDDRRNALDRLSGSGADEKISYVDEDGNELSPDQVQLAMQEGAVFLDEAGVEIPKMPKTDSSVDVGSAPVNVESEDQQSWMHLPDGSVPGFIANRFKSRGTYGANWSGAEEEMKSMQEKGVPLRDPKADAEAWRDAARDLNIEIEASREDGVAESPQVGEDFKRRQGGREDEVDAIADVLQEQTEGGGEWVSEQSGKEEPSGKSEDESLLWSGWEQSRDLWSKAAEDAEPRDPKREVDMWRACARDLTGTAEEDSSSRKGRSGKADLGAKKSAWDVWRTANANWEASITDTENSPPQSAGQNMWASEQSKSDWGAGLSGKTSSERSVWENWEQVKGTRFGGNNSMWWATKRDPGSRPSLEALKEPESNTSPWLSAARELTGLTTGLSEVSLTSNLDENSSEQSQREKPDSLLNFWKEAAKDISVVETDNSQEGEELAE